MSAAQPILWTPRNALQGLLIYTSGDVVAQLLLHQFNIGRVMGVMMLGATIYALEIPNWFAFIDRRVTTTMPLRRATMRTVMALLYFNPLWIARHLFCLKLFAGEVVTADLLRVAMLSWLANLPIALAANALIQVKVPLRWRFLASATFSGLMAVYYALSAVFWQR